MSKAEATKHACEVFGGPAFAVQVSNHDRHKRFIVGMAAPLTLEAEPLGWGDSYETAFAKAEANGFTAERIKEMRTEIEAKLKEQEIKEHQMVADAFVADCVERAKKDGLEISERFKDDARAWFDRAEAERKAKLRLVPEEAVFVPPEDEKVIVAPQIGDGDSPVITGLTWVEQYEHRLLAANRHELAPDMQKFVDRLGPSRLKSIPKNKKRAVN